MAHYFSSKFMHDLSTYVKTKAYPVCVQMLCLTKVAKHFKKLELIALFNSNTLILNLYLQYSILRLIDYLLKYFRFYSQVVYTCNIICLNFYRFTLLREFESIWN